LGLFVGVGIIDNSSFFITFPFKKWGLDPQKMNFIAKDFLTNIASIFKESYNIPVIYEIRKKDWIIKPINKVDLAILQSDLKSLSLPSEGILLKEASLSKVTKVLSAINLESFFSGIFDTRCSLTKSHRRFSSAAPIVSIEIPGSVKNFSLVKDLCCCLTDNGTVPDQILYNHPNQHSPADPNYSSWKKGFKIRFLISSFLAKNSFVLKAKAFDAGLIEKTQKINEQLPCSKRSIKRVTPVSIHKDMESSTLPKEVRNRLFFHYHHFCAILGCKHAPINEIERIVKDSKNLIFAIPRLEKGNFSNIEKEFNKIAISNFKNPQFQTSCLTLSAILADNTFKEYFDIKQGLAYLFSEKLSGKRHVGAQNLILEAHSSGIVQIKKILNTKFSPLLLHNQSNNRAILISAVMSDLNQALIKKRISINGLEVNLI
jgi:hypothetical protein